MKANMIVISLALLHLFFGCFKANSPEEEVFNALQEYCEEDCDMVYIYTPYDCDLCTGNAKEFVLREKSNNSVNICYLLFSKEEVKPHQYLTLEGDTIIPVSFFDKEIYGEINNLTLENKFPVVSKRFFDKYEIIEF